MARHPFCLEPASVLRRYIPGLALAASFSALSALFVLGNSAAYEGILLQMGIHPFYFPFLDTHGILATAECHREGIDVLVRNPCDVLGRTLDYSPFWLITAAFGIGTRLTMKAGLSLDLLFLFWVFFLPPARSWAAVAVMTTALLSSAVALALERANLDLAVFVIALVAAHWSLRGPTWRILGYGLITLAALVKYYPGIMFVVALRERLRFLLPLAVALLAVSTLFVWIESDALARALRNIESGTRFTMSFGAVNLPGGLLHLLAPGAERLTPIAELICAAIAAVYALATVRLGEMHDALSALPLRSRTLMLMGCVLILGCFFAAQNAPYRGIYFLLILPGLTGLWDKASSAMARRRLVLLTGAILFLMWDQFFQLALNQGIAAFGWGTTLPRFAFWFLRETAWWWVVSSLLAILLDLLDLPVTGRASRLGDLALPNAVVGIGGKAVVTANAPRRTEAPNA